MSKVDVGPRVLSAVSLALMLTIGAATSWAADVPGLYSTGVDNAGAPLALGVTDTHWEVQEGALGWKAPLYEKTNYCGSCGGVWVDHPLGDNMMSRPLAHPDHVQAAAPNRVFSWRQSFTLPADADLGSVTIKYKVGYDDQSLDANGGSTISGCNHTVWLNGTAYAMTAAGNHLRTECEATIPAGSNFVNGVNTIEFRVQNLATYYGFRWEKVSATYEPIKREGEIELYSTGVDNAGMPVALGVADPHWEVQEGALGWKAPLYEKTNYCGSCGGVWVDHPLGDNMMSRPLAHPDHVQAAAPNRVFSWRQSFTLPANADPTTATIKYKVGYDDQSLDANGGSTISGCNHTVWLNGTAYAMTAAGNHLRTECEATIPAGSSFVNGVNTIEFRVQNLATYYGFRWEKISATYMMGASMPLTLTLDEPTDGLLTSDNTPTIAGTTTAGATVTLTLVDMTGMVVQTLTPAVDAQGNYTIDAMMLADGSYTVSAAATDAANQMAMAGPRKFGIDSTAPAVTITSFTDGETLSSSVPTIAGVTEPGATVTVIIEDMAGMVVQTLTPAVDAQGNYTIDAMMLADGAYVVTVTSADALGNEGEVSSTLNISTEAMPMVMATITSPADGDVIIGDKVLVKGTAVGLTEVKLFAVVLGINNTKKTAVSDDVWELELTLPVGAHTIEVRYDDEDGDEVIADSVMITMKEDDMQPVAPVVISSPANGANIPAGTIVVSGTGEPGTTVVVKLAGQEQNVTVGEDGAWSATFMDVPKGDQTISATGVDGVAVSVGLVVEGEDVTVPPGGTRANAESEGCACSSSAGPGQSAPMWLLGIFGLMWMRRRKRRA